MRTGRGSRLTSASASKRAPSTSRDLGTRIFWPYREARAGSSGSSMTTRVGTPPACRLRTAPRPTTSELRTTAHGLPTASFMWHGEQAVSRRPRGFDAAVPARIGDVPRQRARHVPRSHDKATQGAEGAGGRRPEEVKARHRRFEPDIQRGIAITGAQAVQQGRRQERVASGVHAITRGEEQVIREAFGAVVEPQTEPRAGGSRYRNRTARGDRYRGQEIGRAHV